MADYDFSCRAVTAGYAGSVQRGAVLHPLMGMPKGPTAVFDKTLKLVDRWRARLWALSRHGWHAKGETPGDQYARNCPPPFAMMQPRSRPCRRTSICPFCYARWVKEVWEVIDAAVPNPRDTPGHEDESGRSRAIVLEGERPPANYPFHLVERHLEVQLPFTENNENYTDYIRRAMQWIIANRSERITEYKPRGAFYFTTVTPRDTQPNPGWLLHHRVLMLVPAEQPTPIWDGRIRRITEPTRREVMNAVIRVCRYPKALMHGDPEMTVAMLNARSRPHQGAALQLSAKYGVFRQSNTR